jgi:hypothetical protein
MNLCGISPIPILITFLCCAALFVYFNLRLAEIKHVVEKQNKVLTAFISNVQQDIRGGGNTVYNHCEPFLPTNNESYLASPEAMKVVQKIEVSDDEYESESEGDNESDSDSESDTEEEEEEDEDAEEQQVLNQGFKQLNLNDIVQLSDFGLNNENSSISVLSFEVLSTSDTDTGNEHSTATNSSISEITDETLSLDAPTKTDTHQTYESMKVDDLRTIVISQNLASKEDSRKLKKPELLALLKK